MSPTATPEQVAERLLRSSAKLSFDPLTEIDWSVPVDSSRYAASPKRSSLYGTPFWDQLTEDQRKELSRQEVASIASTGIWFEAILMQMLLQHVYERDPSTSHVQYAYTEIGDECRHSVMFAKFTAALGAPPYRRDRLARVLGRLLTRIANEQITFAGTLFVEELLDQMQREAIADPALEPLTRQVARIHVTEEARHMRFAREEVIRFWQRRSWLSMAHSRLLLALAAYFATTRLINPACYAAVGLDPKQARKAARRNPYWRASTTWWARKAVETFTEARLMGGPGMYLWRKAGLLEK